MGNTRSLTDKPITKEVIEEDGKVVAAHLTTVVTDPEAENAVQVPDPAEYPTANATQLDPLSVEDDPSPNEDLGSEQPTDQNEIQNFVSADATGGVFTLTYDGQTTDALDWDINASGVTTALTGLSSVGANNVSVTGSDLDFDVEFVGDLAATDVDELTADDAALIAEYEVQTVAIDATGGTFTLSFDGEETAAINHNASANTLKGHLDDLANFEGDWITVTKASSTYTITFVDAVAGLDAPEFVADDTNLTGGAGTATVATVSDGALASITVSTVQDGHEQY